VQNKHIIKNTGPTSASTYCNYPHVNAPFF